ncbi:MAG: DUF3298 and DUF4163 domain-containing protein [Clostridia bacterium]|nr:DUF3298 and DUF4163 domain-containing protein [Clostridia bacterium]
MNKIKVHTAEKELYYQGEVIVKYSIEYPEIIETPYLEGKEIFNKYNRKQAIELKKFAEGEFYNQAKETYKYNKENGYPTMIYEIINQCNITYNYKNLLSLYFDEYTYAGGAHGSTIRKSQTWDLQLGMQIPLQAFFSKNEYYLIDILKQVNIQIKNQIEQGNNIFFPNYCELVLDTFRMENYYLTPKGIVVFFQQYDIAPYSSGIQTFLIV